MELSKVVIHMHLFPFAAMTRGSAGGVKMIEIHDLPSTKKLSAHQMIYFYTVLIFTIYGSRYLREISIYLCVAKGPFL